MMSAESLANRIKSNLEACGFEIIAQNECLISSIAKAIVDEIQQNAEVVGTDSEGGVCTGEVK